MDDEELEEYVGEMEKLLERKLEAGRGNTKCLRLALDKFDMLHRSTSTTPRSSDFSLYSPSARSRSSALTEPLRLEYQICSALPMCWKDRRRTQAARAPTDHQSPQLGSFENAIWS